MKRQQFLTTVLVIGFLLPLVTPAGPTARPLAPVAPRSPDQIAHWQIDVVDSGGLTNSLVLDVEDQPHVSYFHAASGTLRYARLAGSVWLTETVPMAGGGGAFSSIALDSAGRPHISSASADTIYYAYATDAGWDSETVVSAGA